jgi:uncharacterized protein YndB with AHSA1/START domain
MPASRAASSDTFKTTTPSDREIRLTRVFDAPRHLVFEAMTRPEHIKRWWGCLADGYSVPVCDVDLRVGGLWRFISRTPKGQVVAFHGRYREIGAPERLVYTEVFEGVFPEANFDEVVHAGLADPSPDDSVVTTVLADEDGKTRMTVTASYPSIEVRDIVLKSGMEKGAAISYDRLEEVAQELQRS